MRGKAGRSHCSFIPSPTCRRIFLSHSPPADPIQVLFFFCIKKPKVLRGSCPVRPISFSYTNMPPSSWVSPSLHARSALLQRRRRAPQGEHSPVQFVDTTAGGRREPDGDECVHQACGTGAQ